MVDRDKDRKQRFLAQCLRDCVLDQNLRNLEHLLDDNHADPKIIIPGDGRTILHFACSDEIDDEFGAEVCKLLAQRGVSPNLQCGSSLISPLHIAAANGKLITLCYLLDTGANPFLYDGLEKLPVDYAIEEEQHTVIAELLTKMYEKSDQAKLIFPKENSRGSTNSELYYSTNRSFLSTCTADSTIEDVPPKKLITVQIHNIPKILFNDITLNMYSELDSLITEDLSPVSNRSSNTISLSSLITEDLSPNNNSTTIPENQELTGEITDLSEEVSIEFVINNPELFITPPNIEIAIEETPVKCISPIKVIQTDFKAKTGFEDTNLNLDDSMIAGVLEISGRNKRTPRLMYVKSEGKRSKTFACPPRKTGNKAISPIQKLQNTEDVNVSNCSQGLLAAAEHFKHVDEHEKLEFIEKCYKNKPYQIQIEESGIAPLSDSESWNREELPTDYDTDQLHTNLTSLGYKPGPITSSTKRVYLKKLIELCKFPTVLPPVGITASSYSLELEKTLKKSTWTDNLSQYKKLENELETYFKQSKKTWRGGNCKSSFTYLLLDPRITTNLPLHANCLPPSEVWQIFIKSIFYVGKGKRARPYAHLYDAIRVWNKSPTVRPDKPITKNSKLEHILNIWKDQTGVICLHVFQNILTVEAFTREAAMIDALRLENLKNNKSGEYYGCAMNWNLRDKQKFGTYLLFKAMNIFLNEGERQLMPADID